MKRIITICATILMTASVFAQSPEKMSYQAVVRDGSNNLVTSSTIGMRISVMQGSVSGTAVYVETQTPTSNANGLVSLEIGTGTTTDNFSNIDWANGPYFIKTETDPTGGTNYTITGTSQLLSVPYALYAKRAENVPTYTIGDFAQGGIVFWLDETGQHGLAVAKSPYGGGTGVRWYAGTYGVTQAKGDGPYSGEANNQIIISSQVAIGDDANIFAARAANEVQITENGITYGDWYLPSKSELNLIYQNISIINATATANGGGINATTSYWSSTEIDSSTAWKQYFGDGTQQSDNKQSSPWILIIRSF